MQPGQPLPPPIHTSRRQRSDREAFEDHHYSAPRSKPKEHSQAYDQHRTRPKQSSPQKNALEYQYQQEDDDEYAYHADDASDSDDAHHSDDTTVLRASKQASHVLDEYRKEPTASEGTQKVQTKSRSSNLGHAYRYIEPQPAGARKQTKGSSANSAGTERKHRTNQLIRTSHPKPDSNRRPERLDEQAKERTSTNTAGTIRAHSTSHLSSTEPPVRPVESQAEPNVNIHLPPGSSVQLVNRGPHDNTGRNEHRSQHQEKVQRVLARQPRQGW